MQPLRSHHDPHLLLEQHVEQVLTAGRAGLVRHSTMLRRAWPGLPRLLELAIRLHDVGKASAAFQQYIQAPRRYPGDPERKAHTPLSLLAAMAVVDREVSDWQEGLAVVVAAGCHHSGFRTREEHDGAFRRLSVTDALAEQIPSVPWLAVSQAVGMPVPELRADRKPWQGACRRFRHFWKALDGLEVADAVLYRLRVQFLLSLILEADKALLAVKPEHVPAYLGGAPRDLPPAMVETFLTGKPKTPLDPLRRRARSAVMGSMENAGEARLFTATLPTGTGKTLIAASWALRLRERLRGETWAPRIVIVLPYLSIIDQTQKEYRCLLAGPAAPDGARAKPDPSVLMSSHSLAERVFDPEMDGNSNDFFLDTWRSEVVITTFDQFLSALLSPAARHQMRFHHLCDALIIMDEVQTLPCILWHPLSTALSQLTRLGETRVLAMSATQPGFLGEARELVPQPAEVFAECQRYRILLHLDRPLALEEFIQEVVGRLDGWKGQRVLITLNTRRSARAVRDALEKAKAAPLYFITADVTPKDRLKSIKRIKEHQEKGEGCVVVSTQCIEAGVDIDMDVVLRDFAPLDSIVQVAGRCNRNNKAQYRATVEVYSLVDDQSHAFAKMVYDEILLQETGRVLDGRREIREEDVFGLAKAYFDALHLKRNTGEAITKALARWEETDPVRQLLRGKQAKQVTFVVLDQDEGEPGLVDALAAVKQTADRWERRRAHRALAFRLASISVSVYARDDLDPARYADLDRTECHLLLRPQFYNEKTGLDLGRAPDEYQWGVIL